jgi:hypothetical protein
MDSDAIDINPIEDQEYTGGEIKPKPVLTLHLPEENKEKETKGTALKAAGNESAASVKTYVLQEDVDYILSYTDNIVPGMAHITIQGIVGFDGVRTLAFNVTKRAMDSDAIDINPIEDQIYTGEEIKVKPSIHLGNKVLIEGTDYTLSYSDNKNIGTATITITGMGYFTGTVKTTFKIIRYSINSDSVSVTGLDNQIYCGKAIRLKPHVWYEDEELVEGRDYELSWKNNEEPGTAKITITGVGNFGGERTETFTIEACPINSEMVWIYGLKDQKYTGKEIQLKPEVYVGRTRMVEGRDYILRYRSNVEPGTAVVTIIGTGRRITGSTMRTFRIVKAEEKKEEKEEKKSNPYIPPVYYTNNTGGSSGTRIPNTYDTTNIMFWTGLHLLSLAGIAVSFLNLRKMKAE